MNYLLDTTVLIHHVAGDAGAVHLLNELFEDWHDLYTCEVVTCEALSAGGDAERSAVETLLGALEYVAIDPEAARWAAASRRRRGIGGNKRSLGDALIAATAWRLGATVVTRNAADFVRQGVAVREY